MAGIYDPVATMRGVGAARAQKLASLGIHTIFDLLSHFPRQYEDRTQLYPLAQLPDRTPVCFRAMVTAVPRASYGRGYQAITRVTVSDGHDSLTLTFFHRRDVATQLVPGKIYIFYGGLTEHDGFRSVVNPLFEEEDGEAQVTRRIVPVYPQTAGMTSAMLARYIAQALQRYGPQLPETLPEAVRLRLRLCGVQDAYRWVHAPPDFPTLERAQRRLSFEEFFVFSVGLSLMKSRRQAYAAPAFSVTDPAPFLAALPFTLTGAQRRALDDVLRDLAQPRPMNRLVQGDVGSGKTVVAAAAAWCAAESGYQAALMAPTEILAEQHARSLGALLEPLGVHVVLLTGGMKTAQARQSRELLAQGMAQVAVGTHALLTEGTQFHRLGLVIADEQHRFGVAQRAALSDKGDSPHVLVMSATPIPRTLALILYGDLDVSVIDELPPGRQPVQTYLVSERLRVRLNGFIRRQVEEGHQVYIVCPAVEQGETDDLKAAETWAETLQAAVFPDLRVALLHGKMRPADKEDVMRRFAAGRGGHPRGHDGNRGGRGRPQRDADGHRERRALRPLAAAPAPGPGGPREGAELAACWSQGTAEPAGHGPAEGLLRHQRRLPHRGGGSAPPRAGGLLRRAAVGPAGLPLRQSGERAGRTGAGAAGGGRLRRRARRARGRRPAGARPRPLRARHGDELTGSANPSTANAVLSYAFSASPFRGDFGNVRFVPAFKPKCLRFDHRPCLSLWERCPSAARTERANNQKDCEALSVTCGDSSPRGRAKGLRVLYLPNHRLCPDMKGRHSMDYQEILKTVDHTLLKTTATWEQIRQVCDDGLHYGCASVCIPPSYVARAAEYLNGALPVCTVIGFPNGYNPTAVKVFEAKTCAEAGADELDMVVNLGWMQRGPLCAGRERNPRPLPRDRPAGEGHHRDLPAHRRREEAHVRGGQPLRRGLHQDQHGLLHRRRDAGRHPSHAPLQRPGAEGQGCGRHRRAGRRGGLPGCGRRPPGHQPHRRGGQGAGAEGVKANCTNRHGGRGWAYLYFHIDTDISICGFGISPAGQIVL